MTHRFAILRALSCSIGRLTSSGLLSCAVLAGCQPVANTSDTGSVGRDAFARDSSAAAADAFVAPHDAPPDDAREGDDASALVSVDYCPTIPTFMAFNASERFRRYDTGGYDNRPDIGIFGRPESLYAGETFVVRLDVAATDSTVGLPAAAIGFSDIGATRAGKLVSVSRSRCDFSSTALMLSDRPLNAATALFSINEPTRADALPLTTGTWYINVRIPLDQCPPGTACDVVLGWSNG